MKLKRILISLLIILTGSAGLLFGCTTRDLKLGIEFNEEIVSSIELKLPTNSLNEGSQGGEEPENPEDEGEAEPLEDANEGNELQNDGSKALIKVVAENANSVFEQGLDFSFSEANIVTVVLKQTLEDGYVYEITALYPKNVIVTFTTKDRKTSTSLLVSVTQDVEKIEANVLTKNYVVLGENKEISTNIINFTPNTTTNKNIEFVLVNAESYSGITISNNQIIFTDDVVTFNSEQTDKIYVNAVHQKYQDAIEIEKPNFIVENIVFDILAPIGDLAVLDNGISVDSLDFATNSYNEALNYKTLEIKQKISNENNVFEDIHSSYEVKYYFKDNKDDVVSVEQIGNTLVVSQNFRDDECTLVVYAQNKIQPTSEIKLKEIKIVVKTHPSYITVNGERQSEDFILYDNGMKQELNIIVGPTNAYNQNFILSNIDDEYLILTYENGIQVSRNDIISSGTKLFVKHSGTPLQNPSYNSATVVLQSQTNDQVKRTIVFKIVESLKYKDVLIKPNLNTGDSISGEEIYFKVPKINSAGEPQITTFTITSNNEKLYIPSFTVAVENQNIVTVENVNNNAKTFSLKSLTSGTTFVTLKFDNGLEKQIEVNVYMPVDSFKLDVEDNFKTNLGEIVYDNGMLSSFVIKLNKTIKLKIKAYDSVGNLINDKNIYTVNYTISGNGADFIAVSNLDSLITATQETTSPITVNAVITATNQAGKIENHSLSFKVSVYVPIERISISESYFSLYTQDVLGAEDINLSTAQIKFNVEPSNATALTSSSSNYRSPNYTLNFDTIEASFSHQKTITNTGLVLNFTANSLGKVESTIGTITFTVQEFGIVYNKKATIKISKPVTAERILLDNIGSLTGNNNNSADYLYFNLGYSQSLALNPRVYPLDSYNLDYNVEITEQTTLGDPIHFDKSTGVITPVSSGECVISFIPKGVNEANKAQAARTIKVVVGDGSEAYPYKISTKTEFLELCYTGIVTDANAQDEKYTKNYRLINDIDLSGETIFPIGMYITRQSNSAQNFYNFKEFTGSFNGEFKIGDISKSCTISGINLVKDFGDLNIFSDNSNVNYGLFAVNSGTIKNLNLYYSNINIIASAIASLEISVQAGSRNANLTFNFGGIAGVNNNNISNCYVNVYSGNITTYFGTNNIGLLVGKNATSRKNNTTITAKIQECKVSGNLNVLDGVAKYNKENLKDNALRKLFVGGMVGNNEGEILDKFNIYNQDLEVFNKDKISSTVNLTGIYNNNLVNELLILSEESAFGLIAGTNTGTIGGDYKTYEKVGLSSFGYVSAYNNVGGITGINKGFVLNSFTASTVYGINNVGGLIGLDESVNTNSVVNNAVMFVSDGTNDAKISGANFVAGIIGKASALNGSNNFVKTFINKEGYWDIIHSGSTANFGALYSGDGFEIGDESQNENGIFVVENCEDLNNNFANFKLKTNDKVISFEGSVEGVGIIAPESLTVEINDSNLTENTINTYNKFIKANDSSIVLYYYENDKSLNEYLLNAIITPKILMPVYPSGEEKQQLSLIQIESLNKDVLVTNDLGKLIVNKTGEAQIKIYSMLNENAYKIINVKVINAISKLNLHLDSLSPSLSEEKQNKIEDNLILEKGKSENIYLDDFVKQNDIYIEYQYDNLYSSMFQINAGAEFEQFTHNGETHALYKTLNAQVITGKLSGTIKITAKLYVKYFDINTGEYTFAALPSYKEFNLNVQEGLKNIYSSIQDATLVLNSSVDALISIDTDLLTTTNIHLEQIMDGDNENPVEYLNIISEKYIENNHLNYKFKISLNKNNYKSDLIGKTIELKVYVYDNFVSLMEAKNNANYYKTILIKIEENNLINLNMSYFADGEVVKDENGNDVINTTELESNYIKIGKFGILKINVYPIENLQALTLTYTNNENLNLSFKQIRKSGQSYVDVNTSQIIDKGIILDVSKINIDENYVYVKLLTESPIAEGKIFTIKAKINNLDYYYEKPLTTKLATNLELSYNNAILNSNGILEGVYAKGVQENQIISLRVSKLNGYGTPEIFSNGTNNPNLKLLSEVKVSNEERIYNFAIENLNISGEDEYIEIYFYNDKVVNGKTERYISNTLKLNVVDFVVNSISVDGVADSYLTKPYGTNYELKIKLNTTNNPSSEVLNKIASLEEDISKGLIRDNETTKTFNPWYLNGSELVVKDYPDFAITKQNNYFVVSPKTIFKGYNLSANFAIEYDNGQVKYKGLTLQNSKNEVYIENGNYCNKFRENFGFNFYLQTDINNPVPIYSQEDFVSMKENANYILMNDLILGATPEESYTIQNANFNSLDGNGYKITIKNVNIDISTIQNEFKFGLFSETNENTIIKNLSVEYNLQFAQNSELITAGSINLLNISNLTFGGLVAVNNGLIYNCSVLPYTYGGMVSVLNITTSNILNGTQTVANIGGLVGENNGIITNSSTELKIEVNKGIVGGFASKNAGTISSSYYKNAIITNLGEDETTSTTAGFVNINSGIIKYCYVEGEETTNNNGLRLSNSLLSDFCITASTGVGGFVYLNEGEIEDSYSNLSITSQSFSGGFVYTNSNTIKRCYAACLNEQESDAHAPFIATKIDIDEAKMKELIIDCFYLDAFKSSINDNLVTKLSLNQMNDEYYLTNFVVNLENGIWEFRNGLTPTLIETNNKAFSQRRLYNSYVDAEGSTIYNYVYTSYYAGHEKNPIIISSEEEFISYFTVSSSSNRNTYYYRLINNINFSEYSNLPTINSIFSGRLDGNGLEISNLSISAPSNFAGNSFGLFAKIEKYSTSVNPVVKNLKITPLEVYANNVQKVGTLAGSINNADIINVELNASGVIVQGRNIVGGLVGEVKGDSKIINITSSLSVNASFANSSLNTYIYDCDEKDDKLFKLNDKISYAGSICGVVNTNKTTNNNENIRNITVLNGVKSIAEFAGLAFGLICDNSGIDNVKVNVNSSTYLNSLYSAGLIAGENRGYISRAETIYSANTDKDLSIFKNSGFAIGGIVGFNNNGTIVNSIARVSVIGENKGTIVAGGVVGLMVGGSISSVVATNKVNSNKVIGGIIGLTANREMLNNITTNSAYYIALATEQNMEYQSYNNSIKRNNIVYIANTIALNDFNAEDLENKIMGSIIGGAHNSIDKQEIGVSFTIKNSYITNNNYYLPLKYSTTQEKTNDRGETETITINYELKDFGASNIQSIANMANNNAYQANNYINKDFYSAKEITSENAKTLFSRFSNNIFSNTNTNLFGGKNINRSNLNESLLPQLKDTNNINTKSLEGDGTYINPYIINSIEGLNQLAQIVDNGFNKVYVNLEDNIEATGKEIASIGANNYAFDGIFNGNNKFINGLTYINDTEKYSAQNFFGLFAVIGSNGQVNNTNIVANFVINYGSNVIYTGAIAGINNGLISNCNVYGGIVGFMKNVDNNALAYVGGIAGMNSGNANTGIVNSNNHAIIYVTVLNEDETTKVLNNVNIYAGFIAGANTNNAVITKSSNKANSNIDLNSGAGTYTLIVINSDNANSINCNNYVGNTCGYSQITNNVTEYNSTTGNIYSRALTTKTFTGKVLS